MPVCTATLAQLGFELSAIPNIRLDLEDRPQKSPPRLRDRVRSTDRRPSDHARPGRDARLRRVPARKRVTRSHYAGCDPDLPYAFRKLSRDHALTEVYSYAMESVGREPGWHAEHFDLDDHEAERNAEAAEFVEAFLFRRYTAKLGYELEFWRSFPDDGGMPGSYTERLVTAVGFRFRAKTISPTWTGASIAPTTCGPGFARHSSAIDCGLTSARTGGGARTPETSFASCSARARGRRARRSRRGSTRPARHRPARVRAGSSLGRRRLSSSATATSCPARRHTLPSAFALDTWTFEAYFPTPESGLRFSAWPTLHWRKKTCSGGARRAHFS